MRYQPTRIEPVQSKVIIMTGGIKEDISQLETKPGTLLSCQNYEEIDGIFHGYASIKGYERYDGQPLASAEDIIYLLDYGIDSRTSFLLESDNKSDIIDISNYAHPVTNYGVANDPNHKKFLQSSFHFNEANYFEVTPLTNQLDLTANLPRLIHSLNFENGLDATNIGYVVGDIVTGSDSTTTAEVLTVTLISGSWDLGNAVGTITTDLLSGPGFNNADLLDNTVTGGVSTSDTLDDSFDITENNAFRENFTMDWLMGFGTFGSINRFLFEKDATELSYRVYVNSSSKLVFECSVDGSAWTYSLTSDKSVSATETHIAIFRKDDKIYMAFNGIRDINFLTVGTDEIWASPDDLVIGSNYIGKMDEIRICSNYRWLTDFTIPATPYSTFGYYTYQVDDEDREIARALIQPVPGEGPILGIANNAGKVGVVRNDIGGTHSHIYRADPGGWSVPMPGVFFLKFENGIDTDADYEGPLAGSYVRGTSGATAKIVDIATTSGSWKNDAANRDAAGLMVLKDIENGPFLDTDLLTVEDPLGTPLTMTADIEDGTYGEYPLEPDGVYEFINARFAELPDLQRQLVPFFVNGVNYPMYFDGTQLIPILDTKLPDTEGVFATHIAAFKDRLWLAYPDGRIWYSEATNPLGWDTFLGAGEIYMEDEITGLEVSPGGALVVYCRNSIQMIKSIYDSQLGGDTQADYAFFKESFSQRSGAISGTTQRLLGEMYFLDDRGLTKLSTVDTYGDFGHNSVSKNVQKTLASKRSLVTHSVVQRESNQYRMFFSDLTGLYFTFDQEKKIKGITQVKFNNKVRVITEGEDANGDIMILFGSEEDNEGNAYVYIMDSGTSFDGEAIETKLSTAFYSYNSSTNWKRFHKITMETQADKGLLFHGKPEFNYRDPNIPRSIEGVYESVGLGGIWGQDAWGEFSYGSGEVVTPVLYLSGYGNNMSMTIATEDKYRQPHVINSLIVEYSRQGRKM